jgi:hypothetical protein
MTRILLLCMNIRIFIAVTAWCLASLNSSLSLYFSKPRISSPLFYFKVSLENEKRLLTREAVLEI